MRPSVAFQYLVPQRTLSRLVYRATRWTWKPWKDFLISRVVSAFGVDLSQACESDPGAYASFNAFFTRALKPGARPLPGNPREFACPADGRISQIGHVGAGRGGDARIVQAKGFDFSVAELLADERAAESYADGSFVTIYLSPRDYHRVHMPLAGTLLETVHIPGRLFSVSPSSVAGIPRLFARNERLVCHFAADSRPFAVVMVGAMLVSSIETAWGGLEIPPYAAAVRRVDWNDRSVCLERGAEMGRFNMGSTVIVLLPFRIAWKPALRTEVPVQVGQGLGDCR